MMISINAYTILLDNTIKNNKQIKQTRFDNQICEIL